MLSSGDYAVLAHRRFEVLGIEAIVFPPLSPISFAVFAASEFGTLPGGVCDQPHCNLSRIGSLIN